MPCSPCTPQVRYPVLVSGVFVFFRVFWYDLCFLAFLLAANVILEVEGDTADIQSHFATSTTSGSGSVGWGPFSVSSSYSHTDTQASSSCETTAGGCRCVDDYHRYLVVANFLWFRITIKSPQIIGWISEIVPALPRLSLPDPWRF
jgi:hypothetical protein